MKNAREGIEELLAVLDRLAQLWGRELVGDGNFDILVDYIWRLSSSEPREFAANVERLVDDALLREEIMSTGQKLVEQGREEGLQEGSLKRAREDALRMLRKGYPVDDIVEITELSRDEVEALDKDEKTRR